MPLKDKNDASDTAPYPLSLNPSFERKSGIRFDTSESSKSSNFKPLDIPMVPLRTHLRDMTFKPRKTRKKVETSLMEQGLSSGPSLMVNKIDYEEDWSTSKFVNC